jgi:hypothetical protein
MREFRIDEISLVDHPAQQPARVAILKRAEETVKVLPKPSPRESRKDFVSRFMSDAEAKKEFPDKDQRLAVANRKFGKRIVLTTMTAGHAHSILTDMEGGERQVGKTSYADDHEHDWVMDEAGNIILAESRGHSHGVGVLIDKCDYTEAEFEHIRKRAEALGLTELLPEEGALADLLKSGENPATHEAATGGVEKSMTPEEKAAYEKAAQEKLDAVEKRAERAEAVCKLNPNQRTHFDALDTEGQDAFLALSEEDRSAAVKSAQDEDPVVYKAADGTEFRKSDDSRLVELAKRADSQAIELAAGERRIKRAGFEKRANDELGHLKGEVVAKADLLEAVEALPEDRREAVMEILRSQDAGIGAAMGRVGTAAAPDPEAGSAAEKLDAMAKALANKEGLPFVKAYGKVLDTPEGRDLADQHAENR